MKYRISRKKFIERKISQNIFKKNSVVNILNTLSYINKKMLYTKDVNPLINEVCMLLVEYCDFDKAWIVLSEDNDNQQLGLSPFCSDLACYKKEDNYDCDPPGQCSGCPVAKKDEDGISMTACLKYDNYLLGYLNASTKSTALDKEKHLLFSIIAENISFILWSINKKRKYLNMEQQYTELLALSSDAIIQFDVDGKIISINQGGEMLLNCQALRIHGESIFNYCPDHLLYEWDEIKQSVHENGQIRNFITKCKTSDGLCISVRISIQKKLVEKNTPIIFTALVQHLSSINIPLFSNS